MLQSFLWGRLQWVKQNFQTHVKPSWISVSERWKLWPLTSLSSLCTGDAVVTVRQYGSGSDTEWTYSGQASPRTADSTERGQHGQNPDEGTLTVANMQWVIPWSASVLLCKANSIVYHNSWEKIFKYILEKSHEMKKKKHFTSGLKQWAFISINNWNTPYLDIYIVGNTLIFFLAQIRWKDWCHSCIYANYKTIAS